MLDGAVRFIHEHDDFTLICHVSPDGDTLGSALALYIALMRMGKRAQVVCEDPVPVIYRFLPHACDVKRPADAQQTASVIAVDCGDLERTGACGAFLTHAKATLNIDHHETNNRFCNHNFVSYVAAAGELIYHLLVALAQPIDRQIGACLYTAIVTDTGNFAYSNTTPDTLRVVAELLETGLDVPELNRSIYRSIPLSKVRLRGLAIQRTEVYENGRIAVSAISLSDMRACGATAEDSEGVIDLLRDIDTVEIAALLRETETDGVHVSLRGKRRADVSRIALAYSGGGHRLAAGCTLYAPLTESREKILSAARSLLLDEAL